MFQNSLLLVLILSQLNPTPVQ